MENARLSSMISYENWVKNLNKNTKFSGESKLKPQTPSSLLKDKNKKVEREKKLTTSEIWIG